MLLGSFVPGKENAWERNDPVPKTILQRVTISAGDELKTSTYWQILSVESSYHSSGNQVPKHDASFFTIGENGHRSIMSNISVQCISCSDVHAYYNNVKYI